MTDKEYKKLFKQIAKDFKLLIKLTKEIKNG
jgi:hypothetical protein